MRGEELQKLEKHLKEKKQLDLFQCNTIKNIIIADPNLGSDKDIQELSRLKDIFYKMNIIEKYSLEEFNTEESYFKIYYYGSPKKLKIELSEFDYHLKNDQGYWEVYKNE